MVYRCERNIVGGHYLTSSCKPQHFGFGTGASIYTDNIIPAIEKARTEVILVTCFWAESATRDALAEGLRKLSDHALQRGDRVRVRICFSSSSLFQKLFHTSAPSGRIYSPSSWSKSLGLPRPGEVTGLDLEVKSIFFRPFSVMHPKFVIIDQQQVFLPSCNVSWEDWFEGYMLLGGSVVEQFFDFWMDFWASSRDRELYSSRPRRRTYAAPPDPPPEETECVFLPSPHSINPRFRFPWQKYAPPPQTPLNIFLSTIFNNAQEEIFIQTPNVTSPPVLDALIESLRCGTHVTIVTSDRLMILEQLLTAGTTTSRCMKRLVQRYERMRQDERDEEQGPWQFGHLRIYYYKPRTAGADNSAEPVQSHVKLTIIDGRVVIFGSGNMDRASWYTSQELDVAFHSHELASEIRGRLERSMVDRRKTVYTSVPSEQS